MPDNRSHIDQTTIIDLHTAAYGTFRDKMAVVPNDRRFPRSEILQQSGMRPRSFAQKIGCLATARLIGLFATWVVEQGL